MTNDPLLSPQQHEASLLTPLPPYERPGGAITSAFAAWAWSPEGRATLDLFEPLSLARIRLHSLPMELVNACNRDGAVLHPELGPEDLTAIMNALQTGGTVAAVATLTLLTQSKFEAGRGRASVEARWRASPHWWTLRDVLSSHDRGAYAESAFAALAHADSLLKDLLSQVGISGSAQVERYARALSEHEDFGCGLVRTFVNVLLARFGYRSSVPLFSARGGHKPGACTRASSARALAWVDLLMCVGHDDGRQTATDLQIMV